MTLEILKEKYIVCAIIGKRRSGKTYLAESLLTNTNLITKSKNFVIISPTHYQDKITDMKKFALKHKINVYIYNRFPDKLTFPVDSTIFIDDTGVILTQNFENMVFISAHRKWNVILLSQKFKVLGRIRSNTQYFFIFRYTNNMELKAIYEEIVDGNLDVTFKEFKNIANKLNKYECLLIYDDGQSIHSLIVKA